MFKTDLCTALRLTALGAASATLVGCAAVETAQQQARELNAKARGEKPYSITPMQGKPDHRVILITSASEVRRAENVDEALGDACPAGQSPTVLMREDKPDTMILRMEVRCG